MVDASTDRLRSSFDEAAELYDRARPEYPTAVFDELAELAEIGPGARVLEIGCGTGKATVQLANRGYHVTAVELGPGMAEIAALRLAHAPNVRIEVSAFETWPLPPEPFDAVVSATAFHWIDPAVRVVKSAAALGPDGALTTIGTHHIAGGSAAFFEEVQSCYERWMPGTPPGLRLVPGPDIPMDGEEIVQSGLFEAPVFRRFEWEHAYSTAQYLDVLLTYSNHRVLRPDRRERLLDCIAGLIDSRYGGSISKRYMTELRVARKLTIHR
jgi:SAM-dependent methyltransferase